LSNNLKRRDFFKLGLAGTGGIFLKNAPAVFDNTEADSDKRPWWIREVDKPVLYIDESSYSRFDSSLNVFGSFRRYVGEERARKLRTIQRERSKQYFQENKPGYSLRDRSLADASWTVSRAGGINRGLRSWTRIRIRTPEEREVEKYNASPEDAARTIKAAARFFGASTTGITKLDKRHIHSHDMGRAILFENVDQPYEKEDRSLVLPEKCTYAIAVTLQMSLDMIQSSPTAIGSAASALGYSRLELLTASLAEFIRGLGYVAIPSVNDVGSSVAIAIDAGLGELGRTNRLITPEFGPCVRLGKVITDLPMEVDKPIEFGVVDFCRRCKKCAELCPSGALSLEDEPSFEIKGPWNNPGHKAWFEDSPKCFAYWQESVSGCSICIGVCPYSKKDKTVIHEMIKATSSVTPVLDNFFTKMDTLFGYGQFRDPDEWWRITDFPEYGIDTTQGKEG